MPGSKTSKKKITKKALNRKAPSASATLFDIGTKKRGNNGKQWEIVSFNGVKRWTVVKSNNNKSYPINNRKNNPKNDRPSKRKGPIESATLFTVGTKKWGLDGKQWIVTESSTGVKRWSPYNLDTSVIRYKNDTVTFFDADKIIPKLKLGRMKKIGTLNITTNKIGAGELIYNEFPTAKGTYNIYHYNGSLIAIHENESIKGQKFAITKHNARCDIGMFSFNDAGYIKKYVGINKTFLGLSFPNFDTSILVAPKGDSRDYAYVYDSDLDINKNYSVNQSDPIAIFAGNNFGDGIFPIYQGRNAFWIMSNRVWNRMIELVDK